jgi:hypothetical protein
VPRHPDARRRRSSRRRACARRSSRRQAAQRATRRAEAPGHTAELDRQTYQGGTRGCRLCGEDRDRESDDEYSRCTTRLT